MEKLFAITCAGKNEKSFLDLRFGKCLNVVIFNPQSNQYSIIENPFRVEDKSGVQLVGLLKEVGIKSIITGEVGPIVNNLLAKEKIQLILLKEDKIRVNEIMDRINP
jgi:predicted Fe-Mo cluster-binding NifX family protein